MRFKTLQSGLFITLLIAATLIFSWLVSGYALSIFWAIVLTILFHPVHQRIVRAVRGRSSLAALLTISFILIVVLVPIYLLGILVANEAVNLYINLSQSDISTLGMVSEIEHLLTPLQQIGFDTTSWVDTLVSFAQNASAQIGTYALDIGKATFNTAVAAALMLYILFFTLRDGITLGERISQALPLGDAKEQLLFNRFVAIVHAMFKGTFIIAVIQGLIGGILFLSVGIQSAILWAVVMAVFALIPAIGPAIVWLPAGVLLLLGGSTWQGIVVLGVGALLLSTIDNILRPILVARDAAMPDVLILLSVLGGLSLFGIAGIIIGPVISAFFLSMWQLFEHDYAKELKKYG